MLGRCNDEKPRLWTSKNADFRTQPSQAETDENEDVDEDEDEAAPQIRQNPGLRDVNDRDPRDVRNRTADKLKSKRAMQILS